MTLRDFEADVPVVEGGPELRGEAPGTVPPAGDEAVEPTSGGRRRRASRTAISRRLLRVARPVPLLVLALVASLLWAASLGLDARSHHRDAADGREAVAAAQTVALGLTTYDYTRVEQDFAAVSQNLTKSFAGDYGTATATFRKLIAQVHAKATATVLNSGLSSQSDGKAEVIVFVDQTITNDNVKAPRLDRLRMRLTLEKTDGRWLVSGVFLV